MGMHVLFRYLNFILFYIEVDGYNILVLWCL